MIRLVFGLLFLFVASAGAQAPPPISPNERVLALWTGVCLARAEQVLRVTTLELLAFYPEIAEGCRQAPIATLARLRR